MILIASPDDTQFESWRAALVNHFTIYERNIRDRRNVDLCLKKVSFEVIIIHKALLGRGGINELSLLREIQPQTHIIIMTDNPDNREEISAILFGAKAYCDCKINATLLPKVVNTVLANELWVDRKFVSRLLSEIEDITRSRSIEAKRLDKGVSLMTQRESEIARLIATGASNKRIAELLSISERTVKAHLGVIFRKIGLTDRLQLALYMNRHQQLGAIWHGAATPSDSNNNPTSPRKH